jgi:hypothetical protein
MSVLGSAFQLGFEISPIILTGGGGVANLTGGMLPIVAITEAASFVNGILNGSVESSLDDFFAHFKPLPGATLADNAIGHYPFANQAIAANAVITQPLRISLLMICPARGEGGYIAKLATMTALKYTLGQHIGSGGTFTVATPSFIYTNCVLLSLKDISSGETNQAQWLWQWDFEQPLITQQQADQAQNSFMQKVSNGLPTDGGLSGPGNTVGFPPSGAAPSVIPSTQSLAGASSAGPYMLGGSPTS